MSSSDNTTENDVLDVLVIGGGVVGLSVLRSATLAGWKCALVEAQPDLLECASGSNSGIACTGVDALPFTLERALVRDSISNLRGFCRQHNIPHRACGSLVCEWPWNNDKQDCLNKVLKESHDAGDTHASRLQPDEVKKMEPNLNPSCTGAVHIPGEIVLDPWLFPISMACHARENGACIYTNFKFDSISSSWDDSTKTWTAVRSSLDDTALEDGIPKVLKARAIVNATGIHADLLQANATHYAPHWEARPRRGQYKIFSSTENTSITHPIQPVPTQKTKGIFVFSTLYNQVVVGPTADDQQSRTDRSLNENVAQLLTEHAKKILPSLQSDSAVGEYVGIRPGTNHRDYQIRLYPNQQWIVAAGIRSTGLTASLGIGRHVVHLLQSILPPGKEREISTTPLPPVAELVRDFHNRSDGRVQIHKHVYKVTHPSTRLGWEAKTGIAEC